MKVVWPNIEFSRSNGMQDFVSLIAVKMIALFIVLTVCPLAKVEGSSVTMTISDPNPAPVVNGTFETTLSFSTNNSVLGAYHLTIHYNPVVFRILQITTPVGSEFHNNTFIDTNSFSSGETLICAFQTENLSEQPTPEIFATVQWKFLAESIPCSTIYLAPETLVDASWEPIDDFNSSELNLSEDPIPPNVDFVKIPGLQRSTVHFILAQFERQAIVSPNSLTIVGQETGIADLSEVEFAYFHHSYNLWPATSAYWSLPTSLPDDIYTATIAGAEVRLVADPNVALDEDNDCLPDSGDYIISFHRLFGDATGDAVVDYEDFSLLVSRWLQTPKYTGLDINEDDTINFFDFAAFANNWHKSYE
jgi:hypothetical protein